MRQLLLTASLLVTSVAAQAEVLDINIGSDSFRAALSGDLKRLFAVESGRYEFGLLRRQGDRSDGDLLQGHVAALISGDAGARNADLHAGLGVRLMVTDIDPAAGGAVALGGEFELRIPNFNRFGVFGSAFGAPSATSFGDIERYTEFSLALDYQVIRQASVYLGYRNLKYGFDIPGNNDTRTRDSGYHAGLRLNF